ncbi:hypothetical protein G9A89_015334 [Geosiphon pyriformis]|nr:hypothetical protein G9A89_015334 [Geosiphon pyriformis]
MCEYKLISYFIFKSSRAESQARLSSFFAAGAFINDTIWVGNSQSATQYILNIVGKFFQINDILINNNKTVAILINNKVSKLSLSISGLLISIVKKGESHWYLGIFLLTESLLKPSLAITNSDIHFFTNLVLKKTILNKQLLYLVLVVFHSIVSYRMQFSFVPVNVYNNDTIYYLSFYGLKSFLQVQFKSKIASFVSFMNSGKCSVYSLGFPVHIHVSAFNNFLTGMICILLDCNLSLGGFLANFSSLSLLSKKLDPCGSVPAWFIISAIFLNSTVSSPVYFLVSSRVDPLNILNFVGSGSLSVYTNGSLKNLGTVGCKASTAAFFKDINLGLEVGVLGLMLSTMAKLQAIVLALECVPLFSSVHLFLDSQSALDAYKSELNLVYFDFYNQCWIKCWHIVNVICNKNLRVNWHKMNAL